MHENTDDSTFSEIAYHNKQTNYYNKCPAELEEGGKMQKREFKLKELKRSQTCDLFRIVFALLHRLNCIRNEFQSNKSKSLSLCPFAHVASGSSNFVPHFRI